MRETIGTWATRAHLVLVAAMGLTGIGLLLMLGSAMVGSDAYSRDMGLLGAIITAPIWIIGIVAAVDAASVAGGRPVTRRRAVCWALVAISAGLLLANGLGLLAIVGAMVAEPHRVTLGWPAVTLVTSDGTGGNYYYVDQPAFWAPVVALLLGMVSLVAIILDARPRRTASADLQAL